MCADVGGKALDELTRAQRLALWHVLMDGCRRAVDLTEADGQDAKVCACGLGMACSGALFTWRCLGRAGRLATGPFCSKAY